MSNTLIIERVSRTSGLEEETLSFTTGVNLISGAPNTGKSKWLGFIDFLLGDIDKPEDTLSTELSEKYDKAYLVLRIGLETIKVERRWKEKGNRGYIFINESDKIYTGDFSSYILEKLNIPQLRVPKGSPFSNSTWPTLSWRQLYRHIYRQQTAWSDTADRQPPNEQFACLALFLGFAESLYSQEYGDSVRYQKDIQSIRKEKENFLEVLDNLTKDLLSSEQFHGVTTSASIERAIVNVNQELNDLEKQREQSILDIKNNTDFGGKLNNEQLENIEIQWETNLKKKDSFHREIGQLEERYQEMMDYRKSIKLELDRLERASKAGELLSDLAVSHCPVCDQLVEAQRGTLSCYLCKQSISGEGKSSAAGKDRVDYEIQRLREEYQEANDLINKLNDDIQNSRVKLSDVEEELSSTEMILQPFKKATAAIMSNEISIIDSKRGKLIEQMNLLKRVNKVLQKREEYNKNIADLEEKEAKAKEGYAKAKISINLEQVADIFADGMNDYLNALKWDNKNLWSQERVKLHLTKSSFEFLVGKDKWKSKLGGTLILYFWLSYHYSLLNLTKMKEFIYPGLSIVDLPATIEGALIKDQENFVVMPFIELLKKVELSKAQLIMCGSAFEDLEGVNRIELNHIWK